MNDARKKAEKSRSYNTCTYRCEGRSQWIYRIYTEAFKITEVEKV